mmetsp:Transcript_12407/g.35013  ORF Transcript_12407/g.35013 Transcript_12407/m.35013 type:complete len:208 (+) Transcript_12407:98-721(+)
MQRGTVLVFVIAFTISQVVAVEDDSCLTYIDKPFVDGKIADYESFMQELEELGAKFNEETNAPFIQGKLRFIEMAVALGVENPCDRLAGRDEAREPTKSTLVTIGDVFCCKGGMLESPRITPYYVTDSEKSAICVPFFQCVTSDEGARFPYEFSRTQISERFVSFSITEYETLKPKSSEQFQSFCKYPQSVSDAYLSVVRRDQACQL